MTQDSMHSPQHLIDGMGVMRNGKVSPGFMDGDLPSSLFDVEVVAHRIDGEGSYYDDHIFNVDIHCESMYYFIERSYVDFVELHETLMMKFPLSEIPPLPLSSFSALHKPMTSSSSLSDEPRAKVLIPDNTITEDVANKRAKLQLYMRTLLTYPEVAGSDEFISFLDEEIKCNGGRVVPKDEISEIDLLLMSTPAVTVTVKGTDTVSFDVQTGQLIIWKFYVDHYDIGFAVDMENEVKMMHTYYSNTADFPVRGLLLADCPGSYTLKWDSAYEVGEVVTRQVRVVRNEEYNAAKDACSEAQLELQKYESQREALRETLRYPLVSNGTQMVSPDPDNETSMGRRDLEEAVRTLKQEKKELQVQLDDVLLDLEQLSDRKAHLEGEVDQLKERLLVENEELSVADNHIDVLEATVEKIEGEKAQLEDQVADLRENLEASVSAAEIAARFQAEMEKDYAQEMAELKATHDKELERCETAHAKLEQELNRQLAEKTALAARLQSAEEKVADKDASIHAIDDKRVALMDHFDRATKDAAALREELASMQAKLDATDRSAKQADMDFKVMLAEFQEKVNDLTRNKIEADEMLLQSKEKATVSDGRIADLEQQLAVLQKEHERELADLQVGKMTEIAALRSSLSVSEAALNATRDHLTEVEQNCKAELAQMDVRVAEEIEKEVLQRQLVDKRAFADQGQRHEEEITRMANRLTEMEDALSVEERKRAELSLLYDQSVSDAVSLREEVTSLNSRSVDSDVSHRAVIAEYADIVAELQAKNRATEETLLQWKEKASASDSHIADLEQQLVRMRAEGNASQAEQGFKTQLGQIQKRHAEELKTLEQNKQHELLVRLAEMDERYQSEIADSVAQLKAENASQRDSTAVLETELNRVKGQLAQAEQAFKTQLGLIQKQHAEELKTLEQNNKHELLVRLAGLDEQYQSEIVDLTAQLADREESQNATGRELARSTSTVQDVTTELENLKSRHAEQVKTLEQNRQDRIAEMEDQMDRIKWRSKEEIDQLHTENAALQKELKSLQDAISSGRMASDKELELRRQIEILQTDHTEALSNLTNQTADDVSTAEDAKEIERLTSNLRQVNDTLATRDKHIRTLDDKRIELLHLYDRSTRDVADLRKELSSVRSQLDLKTRSILAEGEQKSADNLSHLLREKRELVERVHELEDQLGRNQKHVDALTKSVCDLEDALSTARSDLKGSHTQISALQGQLAGMGSADQLKDLQRTHANVVMELEFVRRQFDEEVKKEKSGHEKMVKETEKRLAKSQKLLEKALNRISGLEHSESNHDVIVRLHMELAESRKEVADYAQELLESAGREDVMQQNISDLQQEVVMLVARIQSQQDQIDDLESFSFPHLHHQHPTKGHMGRFSYDVSYGNRGARGMKRAESMPMKPPLKADSAVVEALTATVEKHKNMYEEKAARCAELEKQMLDCQEQSDAKVTQVVEEMQAEIDRLQAETYKLQRYLLEARKEAGETKLSVSAEKFRAMYVETIRRCSELEKEILVAQEQGNAKTMQAMENMHAELGQVQAENHDLQRDLYEARKEANDSKMLIQQLELRYQEKLRELQDVKDQLRKVRSSVSDFYAPLQKMFDSDSTSA